MAPVLLPRKSHGWRSLEGYSPGGRKELDMTEQLCVYIYIYMCVGVYVCIYIYIYIYIYSIKKQRSWHLVPSLHDK